MQDYPLQLTAVLDIGDVLLKAAADYEAIQPLVAANGRGMGHSRIVYPNRRVGYLFTQENHGHTSTWHQKTFKNHKERKVLTIPNVDDTCLKGRFWVTMVVDHVCKHCGHDTPED